MIKTVIHYRDEDGAAPDRFIELPSIPVERAEIGVGEYVYSATRVRYNYHPDGTGYIEIWTSIRWVA